jgi:hypothetical protein
MEPSFKLHTVDPTHESQTVLNDSRTHDWTRFGDIKKFFRGAFPKPKGGRLFLRVKASFNGTLPDLLGSVGWYYREAKKLICLASLQCFRSDNLGFLMYSLRHSDPEPTIEDLKHDTQTSIAMRWTRIHDGTKYDSNHDSSEDPKALHVECAVDDAETVTEVLRRTYGSQSKTFL